MLLVLLQLLQLLLMLQLQMLLRELIETRQAVVAIQRVARRLEEGEKERHVLGQVVGFVLRLRSALLLDVAREAGTKIAPSLLAVYDWGRGTD